jgi:membrane protease YdiL (CAAX protease family)
MTLRGALVIAVLVELLSYLVGWMLRIRGISGVPVKLAYLLPAIAVNAWLFLRFFRFPPGERRGMPRDPMLWLIIAIAIAVVPFWGFEEKPGNWEGKLLFLVFVAIVVFKEELFYRGILQTTLERAIHPVAAIVLANVGFIASHAPVMEINALSVGIIAAAGFLSGVVYQVTRSLAWATVLHVLGDWALVVPAPALLSNDVTTAVNLALVIAILGWWTWWHRRVQR